jgi:hypothetical protein
MLFYFKAYELLSTENHMLYFFKSTCIKSLFSVIPIFLEVNRDSIILGLESFYIIFFVS